MSGETIITQQNEAAAATIGGATKRAAKKATKRAKKFEPGAATIQRGRMPRAEAASAVRANVGPQQTLHDFRRTVADLTSQEREEIVEQALAMLEQVYVHLPLKRAMYAVDPIQRLKLLRLRMASMTEAAFHDEMITTYSHLRDLHTSYVLPQPYQSLVAVLPFRIEAFFEGDVRRYVVTQVSPLVEDKRFKIGVIPTHWNGIPIERAVELNAEREAGSNLAARLAQGVEAMTTRWMGRSLPPDEEWVVIRYADGSGVREARFEWEVLPPGSPASGADVTSAEAPAAAELGINAKAEVQRRVRKLLFSPESMAAEQRTASLAMDAEEATGAAPAAGVHLNTDSILPDAFDRFGAVETPHGTFGYIRIRTFNVHPERFIPEFIRLIALLPQHGLIIDVRGNGGGFIAAGETLLQTLTPRLIEPALFSFISSPLTYRLCENDPNLAPWKDSIKQSIETAAAFSQGLPLTPVEKCNDIGQKYHGPVVLITDAMCYSTTDMFAAGFQDHEIGKILGTATSTGAGGANVWSHERLVNTISGPDSPFRLPPRHASFQVAIRRSTRVGKRAGVLLEDLGVVPDEHHRMTKQDILSGNIDLINHAASMLKEMPGYALSAKIEDAAGNGVAPVVTVTTKNLDRLDVYLDGRPRLTLDSADGDNSFNLPATVAAGAAQLELRGYKGSEFAASTRLPVFVAAPVSPVI
ncbi:MAG: S41 family peptidase [Acidobacteriota bacterium]|nr:S41 family peptidase [Acidobacteriota bacterium]